MEKHFNGNILDPIHGLIRLSDIEKWFMYQRQFSRLRTIRQNAFVYYVFPSANHTRFEHSIGVMHLANQILDNALSNNRSGEYRKIKHDIKSNTKGFHFLNIDKLYENHSDLIKVHTQELRLAALLHDVGHGPFSHKFDSFALDKTSFLQLVKSCKETEEYYEPFEKLLTNSKDNKISHEHLSCFFILELIEKLKKEHKKMPDKFVGDMAEMIESINGKRTVRLIEPKLDFGADGKMLVQDIDLTHFYSTIISSFPVDADRMDYLLRDGSFSGVKYGVYDLARLYMSFIPIIIDNKGYLAIKESGVDACTRLVESRAHLFNIVYSHKTNISSTVMLDYIFEGFEDSVINVKDYKSLIEFYWINSDEYFLRQTIPEVLSERFKSNDVLTTHRELQRRRLWKKIYTKRITLNDDGSRKEDFKKLRDQINSKLTDYKSIIARCNLFINPIFKDSRKSKLKIVVRNDSSYHLGDNWETFSPELQLLNNTVYRINIFMERKFTSSNEFINYKKEVLDLVKDELTNLEELNLD